jgi:hypothetical protein
MLTPRFQVDPKFLKNMRHAKKSNKKSNSPVYIHTHTLAHTHCTQTHTHTHTHTFTRMFKVDEGERD